MAIWERNGHIIEDASGNPIECPWCPCGPTTCDEVILQQIAKCESAGAYYMNQTGFLYSTTDAEAAITPTIFHWISWSYDSATLLYTCHLYYLDCDCEQQLLATQQFAAPPPSPAEFGYAFFAHEQACEDIPCNVVIAAFVATSVSNGWSIHGNGVLVRKQSASSAYYSWIASGYASNYQPRSYFVCADTGSSFVYIDCYCSQITLTENYELYTCLDYSACDCFDIRELLLAYPDVFGILDISFGDDTVYTLTSGNYTTTDSCLPHVPNYSYATWACDYRNMYVIFDEAGIGDYGSSVSMHKFTPSGVDVSDRIGGDTIVFDGKVRPFTTREENQLIWPDASINLSWKGLTILWQAQNSNAYMGTEYGAYYSQQDAQDALDYLNSRTPKYGTNSFTAYYSEGSYFYEPKASVRPPDFTPTAVEGSIEYSQDDSMYHVYMPHYEFNANGVYRLNFAVTNKGFLVNGEDGFVSYLEIPGFTDSIAYFDSPPTEEQIVSDYYSVATKCSGDGMEQVCEEGSVLSIAYGSFYNFGIPLYDITVELGLATSMGGCQTDAYWEAIMEEAESSSESSGGE